jgi:hydroxymethylglutaryl-CoA lyase
MKIDNNYDIKIMSYKIIMMNFLYSNSYKTMKLLRNVPKYVDIYKKIRPVLTDVSLRDGLQTERQEDWPLSKKKSLLHEIVFIEKPDKIEVGSFVSPYLLPIMGDTDQMFHYASNIKHNYEDSISIFPKTLEIYVLVPSYNKLEEALNHQVKHMSFITSCSNSFQKKNVNKTIEETKNDLDKIFEVLKKPENQHIKKKLYISCVTECPIEGKIDIDFVLHEICKYNIIYEVDEICLSDTCGTLTFEDYKYIVETLFHFGVPRSKIGIHLHVDTNNQVEARQIVMYSLKNNISKFDVSMLTSGGCSLTIKQAKPNMTYDFFYSCLYSYLTNYEDN